MATIGVLWAIEDAPIRYLNEPFPTVGVVRAGDRVQAVISRCNDSRRDLLVSTVRQLRSVDTGDSVNLPPGIAIVPAGCSETIGDVVVPRDVRPGRYRIEYVAQVKGRWRLFEIPLSTMVFEVGS